MRDRYEKLPRGHSFGATHSGITNDNRPILELVSAEWESYIDAFARIKAATGRSPQSISACLRSLRRHGLIEWQPASLDVPARMRSRGAKP
jgi:predicted transcriptional regulator